MLSRAWLGAVFAATSVTLALALSACGTIGIPRATIATKTVTATAAPTTTSTTSPRDALAAWHDVTLVPAQEVRDASRKISAAADAGDLTTMGIACQEMRDAVADFQQHMPSPDAELNAQLQKALSDYSAGASICTTAVENRNIDDFRQGTSLVSEGNTYMGNAVKVLERDLGESSDSSTSPSIAAKPADPEADSLQQLQQQASSDRSFVKDKLAGWWIPQLSSKRPGLRAEGIVWDNVQILREHLQLRSSIQGRD